MNLTQEDLEGLPASTQIAIEQFWRILDKKIRDEKLALLANLAIQDKRQKWAWIFERKFTRQWALSSKLQEIETKSTNKEDLEDAIVSEVEITIVHRPVDNKPNK